MVGGLVGGLLADGLVVVGVEVDAGVVDPLDPRIESAQQVRDRVLLAAEYLDPHRLGTTDDAGFAPFFDDDSVSRATAFAKLRARVEGTRLASALLEGAA